MPPGRSCCSAGPFRSAEAGIREVLVFFILVSMGRLRGWGVMSDTRKVIAIIDFFFFFS